MSILQRRTLVYSLAAAVSLFQAAHTALAGGIVVTATGPGSAVHASSSQDHSVYGRCTAASVSSKYAGYFVGDNFRALYAYSTSGWYDAFFPGIGGIYVAGGVWSRAASSTLVVNGGDEPLEAGDIVALAGVTLDPFDQRPMLLVAKASAARRPAIVKPGTPAPLVPPGHARKVFPADGAPPAEGGGHVEVDEAPRATLPDELLVPLLGMAAGPADPATGTVPVFVILR